MANLITEISPSIIRIEKTIHKYMDEGKTIFVSSSFQTHSIPLLHILSSVYKNIPVYFLNTGFHFPETLGFRDQVTEQLGLNLISIRSEVPRNLQKNLENRFLFASDTSECCYINKVQPLEKVLIEKDVWISGVRADQNMNRKNLKEEELTPTGTLRYHPMLKWTNKMIFDYRKTFNLPEHPLEKQGIFSVGCEPCTRSYFENGDSRNGRWQGTSKNECGLHLDLVAKK